MGTYIDEVTGLEVDDEFKGLSWEFWICNDAEHTPAGHRAMGFGIAHACAPTLKEARERQLELGLRATTVIVDMETGEIH